MSDGADAAQVAVEMQPRPAALPADGDDGGGPSGGASKQRGSGGGARVVHSPSVEAGNSAAVRAARNRSLLHYGHDRKALRAQNTAITPTSALVLEYQLRLELLHLFDAWDTNGDHRLTTVEILCGIYAAGLTLGGVELRDDPGAASEKLRELIDDVADPSKDGMTPAKAEHYGHHFLDNAGFLKLFMHPNLLGGYPPDAALEIARSLRSKITSDPATAGRLARLRDAQPRLISGAQDRVAKLSDAEYKAFTTPRTVSELHMRSAQPLRIDSSSNSERRASEIEEDVIKHARQVGGHTVKRGSVTIRYEDAYESSEWWVIHWLREWWSRGSTKPSLAIIVWLFAGAILFSLLNEWGFNEAFYYSVQSGLSVGFGSLSEEKLTGRNTIDLCVDGFDTPNATELLRLVLAAQADLGGDMGGQVLCANQHRPNPNYLWSMAYCVLHICLGASVIGGALSLFSAMAVESSKDWYEDAEAEAKLKTKRKARRAAVRRAAMRPMSPKEWAEEAAKDLEDEEDEEPPQLFFGRCDCSTDAAMGWIRKHPQEIKAVTALIVYVIIGSIVYAVVEDVHIVKGAYFAVAACSTAGLAGPSGTNSGSIAFVGLFTLFGVPLYGYTLGIFANGVTAQYIQAKAKKTRLAAITDAEFAAADRLGDSGAGPQDDTIDRYEFALLYFLRNGLVTNGDIETMQKDFDELDADDNQVFDRSEMQAAMQFSKFDENGDDQLSGEFWRGRVFWFVRGLSTPPQMRVCVWCRSRLASFFLFVFFSLIRLRFRSLSFPFVLFPTTHAQRY